jgi:hypothetical protein
MGNDLAKVAVGGAMDSVGLGDSKKSEGGGGENSMVDGITEAAEGIYNGVTTGASQGVTSYKLAKSRNVADDLKAKYKRDGPVSRVVAPEDKQVKEKRERSKKAAENIKAKYNK